MPASPSFINEMEKSQLLLVLLEEEMYTDKMAELVKSLESAKKKICYVCLSKPYMDIYEDLKGWGMNMEKIHFIDVLSSHYGKKESTSNCTFLDSPTELEEMRFTISKMIKEKGCRMIVVDTISTMLVYQKTSNIVRFTHEFLTEEKEGNDILYLVLKHDSVPMEENDKLVKDLSMFADRTIDLEART